MADNSMIRTELKMRRCARWLVGAAIVAFPASAAAAQTAEPPTAQTAKTQTDQAKNPTPQGGLEDIVVTARKVSEDLQTTPIAVTALTSKMLESRNFSDITDLAQATPNLVLQTSGANGSSKTPAIFLRGLGQADTVLTADPAVGLYVDGVYMARNTGNILDLVDLERVEVLRGPQGTLFGKNTIGGAINLITQKPKPEFGASAELTAGNYSRLSGKAMINVPLTDSLFARVSGFGNRQDGYIKLANYRGRQFGDDNTWGARGQLRWEPSSSLTADLAVDYSSTNNTGAASVLLATYPGSLTGIFYNALFSGNPACNTPGGQATIPACFGPIQVPKDPYVSNVVFTNEDLTKASPENKFTNFGASLTVKIDLPFGALQSISAYRGLRSNYSGEGAPIGHLYFETLADRQNADQYSEEIQLTGKALNDRLKWILGGYFLYEYTLSHVDVLSAAAAAPFLGTTYPLLTDNLEPTHTYNAAAFGQATFDITRWLHLTGGLRWTYEKKDAILYLRPARPQGLAGNLTVRRATPLVSLGADLSRHVFAYASYSEGFRSGGFPPRVIGQISYIPAYGPETAKAYEVGIKTTALDNKLRANFAAFSTSYTDFQGQGTLPNVIPAFGTVINAGDARIKGFELELTAAPSRHFQVHGNVSYLATRLTRADPSLNVGGAPVPLGSHLPFAPEWKASTGFNWTIPFANGGELATEADIALTSRIYYSLLNEVDTSQASTVLVNGGLTYSFPGNHWQVAVGVKNATNSFYYTSKARDRNTTGTLTGVLAPPRTWFGSIRWRY